MRRVCLLVTLGVLVTVLAACGSGEPVAGPDAGSASAGTTSTTAATTTTASPVAGPFIVTTTAAVPPTTAAPATTTTSPPAPTTAAPTTTTTTSPPAPTTAAPVTTTTSPPAPPTTAPPPAAPTAPGTSPAQWTVKTGESFWSVAESVVGTRLGRAPTNAEIDTTWRAIIAANRQNLPNPANPDVLWVGTVLTIPA